MQITRQTRQFLFTFLANRTASSPYGSGLWWKSWDILWSLWRLDTAHRPFQQDCHGNRPPAKRNRTQLENEIIETERFSNQYPKLNWIARWNSHSGIKIEFCQVEKFPWWLFDIITWSMIPSPMNFTSHNFSKCLLASLQQKMSWWYRSCDKILTQHCFRMNNDTL